jgi:NTE family protein
MALAGCQTPITKKNRADTKSPNTQVINTTQPSPEALAPHSISAPAESSNETVEKAPPVVSEPLKTENNSLEVLKSNRGSKVGLILGPGGMRSYAHIGALQELARARINIAAVAGYEMGALVAGLYAQKAQAFDVEWQMFKIKEEEILSKGFINSQLKASDVQNLIPFLQETFGQHRVEDAKIPFYCTALNLNKKEVYLMSKGPWSELLPFCLPSLPLFKPYKSNVSALTSIDPILKSFKLLGIQKVIYVDLNSDLFPLFSSEDLTAQWAWAQLSYNLKESAMQRGVEVLSIPLTGIDNADFSKRRESLRRGQESGKTFIRERLN